MISFVVKAGRGATVLNVQNASEALSKLNVDKRVLNLYLYAQKKVNDDYRSEKLRFVCQNTKEKFQYF